MGLVIGMDEAGYGPNLGPLVVTVTAWDVPGPPREADFWGAFADAVTSALEPGDARLHVADSKRVYSPSKGIASLERSVLCAMNLCGSQTAGYWELRSRLAAGDPNDRADEEPWHNGCDLSLPHADHGQPLVACAAGWQECCRRENIHLRAVRADVVSPARFNRLIKKLDSKGAALSALSLRLLRRIWDPDDRQPVLVVADKHGGRNRYDRLIAEVLDGQMIFRRREGREQSCYSVGSTELCFLTRAESHFPVALASMIAKYLRELSMELFNRFWRAHVPGLRRTAGYPADAGRFRRDIAEAQRRLGIPDDVLWRAR